MAKKKTSPKKTSSKKKSSKRKLSRRGILIVCVLALVLCVIGGAFFWKQYQYRFSTGIVKKGVVQIPSGTSFEAMSLMLVDSGYVANAQKWASFARSHGVDSVRGGNYALSPGMSYRTALTTFFYGRQTPVRLTFNNIRTMDRLAGTVSRYIEPDSLQMIRVLNDPATAQEYGFTKATFPALFIPNTYEVYWTLTPEGFVERMHKEYERFWNEDRKVRAEKLGYTPDQISTIASIVIEETKFQGEMTDVAGVYLNRLKVGMPLQADPTAKFAAGDFSIRRVLDYHKTIDSPYNTYKYAGLPPGPICVPPINAIDAVLAYADADKKHGYYYFCAKADFSGKHAFAKTLSEHNRNAAAYHAELNRRGIR